MAALRDIRITAQKYLKMFLGLADGLTGDNLLSSNNNKPEYSHMVSAMSESIGLMYDVLYTQETTTNPTAVPGGRGNIDPFTLEAGAFYLYHGAGAYEFAFTLPQLFNLNVNQIEVSVVNMSAAVVAVVPICTRLWNNTTKSLRVFMICTHGAVATDILGEFRLKIRIS